MTTCTKCGSKKVPWITTWDCPNGCDANSPAPVVTVKKELGRFIIFDERPNYWYVKNTMATDCGYEYCFGYGASCRTYTWFFLSGLAKELGYELLLPESGVLPTISSFTKQCCGTEHGSPVEVARSLGLPEHPTKEQLLGKGKNEKT